MNLTSADESTPLNEMDDPGGQPMMEASGAGPPMFSVLLFVA